MVLPRKGKGKYMKFLSNRPCIAAVLLLISVSQTSVSPVALDSFGDVNRTGYIPQGIVFTPNGNALAEIAIQASTGLPGFSMYQFSNGSLSGTPQGAFVNATNASLSTGAGVPCLNGVRWLPNTSMAAALFMLNSSTPNSGSLNLNTFNCPTIANGSNATSSPILGNVNASFLNGNLSANCCMDVSADGQYMAITDTIYDGNALSSTLYVLSQEGAVLALAALGNTLPGSISISPVSSAGTYYITVGGLDSTLRAFSFTANTVSALTSLGSVGTSGGGNGNSFAWHPSGRYFIVGTNVPNLQVFTFNGISAPVLLGSALSTASTANAVAWSPNGTYVAVADGANNLKVYSFTGSTPTLAQVGSTVALAGSASGASNLVTWSPNSNFIAVVTTALQVFSFNGTSTPVKIGLNLTTGLSNAISVSWSPNGSYLAVGNNGNNSLQLFTFSTTSTPTIAASGNPLFTNTGASGLFSVSWSPNGNYLAVVDNTNTLLGVYVFSGGTFTQIGGNVATGTGPNTVSWSPNGNYISVTNANGASSTIQTYSFNGYSTPTPIAAGTTPTGNTPRGAWSPIGNYFAVFNGNAATVQAFSWPYNTPLRIGTSLATGTLPTGVAWSPNGNYLVVANSANASSTIQAYSFSTTNTPTTAALGSAVSTGVNSNPYSVAFSPNGNYIAVATEEAGLQVYSFAAGTPVQVGGNASMTGQGGSVSVAWSPNGNYIAVVGQTSPTLQVFSFSGSSTPIQVGSATTGSTPASVSWSPNGNYIAVVNSSPTNTLQVFSFSGRTPVQVGSVGTGASSGPVSVAWSPNGNYLAVANSALASLQLQVYSFSGTTPVLLGAGTTTGTTPFSVAWSPNGNYLVVANQSSNNLTVYYFDGTNTPVLEGSTITTGAGPSSVVWSPNGQFIAAVNQTSATLQLFTAPIFQNGQPLLNQLGNTVSTANPVTSVAFSPNGNYIATAGTGIQLYSFNNAFSYLTTNTTAITLRGSAAATSAISRQCVWSPAGNYLATVLDNATLSVLSFNPSAPTTPTVVASATTMPLPTMCAWSPNGNAYNDNYIVTASALNGGARRLFYFDPFGSTNYYG